MMSKSSFLVSLKENNKRRIAVWLLAVLNYILLLPLETVVALKEVTRRLPDIVETYGEAMAQEMLLEGKLEAVRGVLGCSDKLAVMVFLLAAVSAFQGFSWLYSRKKVDFYFGMPVKRNKRFWVIWLNGVLTIIISYGIGLAVSLLIAAGNGACDGRVLGTAFTAYGVISLMGLGVYHMAILAVMLTGNGVIAGLGFLVFCLYEFMVRTVLEIYQSNFFRYKSHLSENTEPFFSPPMMLSRFINAYESSSGGAGVYVAQMLFFALAVGGIAWFAYLKRPAEVSGRAMAFRWMEAPLKILLVIPAALLAGMFLAEILSLNFIESPYREKDNIGMVVVALVVSVVLLCALLQAVYEFDVKAIFHQKRYMLICGGLALLCLLFFRYDVAGYDTWVPDAGKLESAALVLDNDYYGGGKYGNSRLDENGNSVSFINYAEKYMELKDTEDICNLASSSMEEYAKLLREKGAAVNPENMGYWHRAELVYRMKNGRKVYRQIAIRTDDEQTRRLLDKITETPEFQSCYFDGMTDRLEKQLEKEENKVAIVYTNEVYEQPMAKAEMAELLEAYRKDVAKTRFTRLEGDVPVGIIVLQISRQLSWEATRTAYVELKIQSFYENSIAWLKEHGYYMEPQLRPEDVERIQVCNFHYEINAENEGSSVAGDAEAIREVRVASTVMSVQTSRQDFYYHSVYADYTDEASILAIANASCPAGLYEYHSMKEGVRDNYAITVYFKSDSEIFKKYGAMADYRFMEGQVPLFVQEDTVYE